MLLIFCILKKKTYPAYISKHNSTHEKQIILLMIPSKGKKEWYYLPVKKLSALLHRITSKTKSDFYCLICLILLEHKIDLNFMKKYLKIIFVEL